MSRPIAKTVCVTCKRLLPNRNFRYWLNGLVDLVCVKCMNKAAREQRLAANQQLSRYRK